MKLNTFSKISDGFNKVSKRHLAIGLVMAGSLLTGVATSANAEESTSLNLTSSSLNTEVALLLPAVQKASDSDRQEINIRNIELLEKIDSLPRDISRFQAQQPSRTDIDRLIKIAFHLAEEAGAKFDKKAIRIDEHRIAFRSPSDPSATIEINRLTGALFFNSGLAKYREEASTYDLPREGVLEQLALEFMQKYGLGINPEELNVAHLGGLNMGVTEGNGSKIFEKLKTVRFERSIGKIPVDGDSRLILHYGESGTVSAAIVQLPQLGKSEPLDRREIVDPKRLRQIAAEELAAKAGKAVEAELVAVDLVLYDDGEGIYEPAYHITMERQLDLGDRETTMIPYDFYLPVSEKPVGAVPLFAEAVIPPKSGADTSAESANDIDD